MRVLLDTNVLIDFFGRRPLFYNEAAQLKAAAFFGDIEVWATANSLTDVFYVLHKNHDSLTIQEAFLSSRDTLHICSVTSEDIYTTAERKWPDFEDCLIDVCARSVRADYLLSRDREGFAHAETNTISPEDFLILLREQTGISYAEIIDEQG